MVLNGAVKAIESKRMRNEAKTHADQHTNAHRRSDSRERERENRFA
jgi:hypothetical protein